MTAASKTHLCPTERHAAEARTPRTAGPIVRLAAALVAVMSCANGSFAQDCNNNGIPDVNEIAGTHTALDFDGSDDYVRIPRSAAIEPKNEMTWEAWVRPDTVGSSNAMLCRIAADFSPGYIVAWQWGGAGRIQIRIGWATNGTVIIEDTTPTSNYNGQWTHVAFTYSVSGNAVRLFVNGVQKATAAAVGPLLYSNADMFLGNSTGGPSDDFDGRMDEVRIWNVARTQAQINTYRVRRLIGNEPGLVGYWRFDAGSGQSVLDSTANGNNGTLGGSAGVESTDPTWITGGAPLLINDCNGNGTLDECDITSGFSTDCNSNSIPDECEVNGANDCNHNGTRDICEVGGLNDCDGNGVTDLCELDSGATDCNNNGIPDRCDASAGNFGLRFDGVDDVVNLPASVFPLSTTLTVEAWFKTTTQGVIFGYQGGAYPNGVNGYQPVLYVGTNGKLHAKWYDNQTPILISANAVNDGQWHHAALVGNVNTQNLYLDGNLVAGSPLTGTINHQGWTNCQIGTGFAGNVWPSSPNTWFPFGGSIDEVRLWNVARSQAQIVADMKRSISGTRPGLMLNWRMNEGTGQTVNDASGNNRHGTLGTTATTDTNDPAWAASGVGPASPADCNGNGIPDACDLANGGDCNNNGQMDACEINAGTVADCNGNFLPDSCELSPTTDCNANGQLDACETRVTITHRFKACIDGGSQLIIRGNQVQWHQLSGGAAAPGREPGCNGDQTTWVDGVAWIPTWPEAYPAQIRYDAYSSIYTLTANPFPQQAVSVQVVAVTGRDSITVVQPSAANAFATIVYLPDPSSGPFTYEFDVIAANVVVNDCDADQVPNSCEIGPGVGPDCNANTVPDSCDITNSVIADSFADFSNVQGYKGWYYGYYVSPFNSQSFQLLTQYGTNTDFNFAGWYRQLGSGGFYTSIGSNVVHPNGTTTSNGRQAVAHWVCRRWISDRSGPAVLRGGLAKSDTNSCGGCDGVRGRVLVDGVEIWNQLVAQTDGQGYVFNLPVNLTVGAKIDFVLDPVTSDGKDLSYFSASITGADCNNNGLLDSCDIASGTSGDCDGNGVPDECQPNTDCNNNGVRDLCEAGGSADCDGNGVTNLCQIAAGAPDCNANGVPDSCDVLAGNYVLRFDDVNDRVRVPRTASLEPGSFTIELWAYFNTTQSRNTRLVRKVNSKGFIFAADQDSDQRVQLRTANSTAVNVADTQSHAAYVGGWHHFAATYSPTQAKLYVDGVLKNTTTHSAGPMTYTADDLYIAAGLPASDTSEFFGGSIDEVRFWTYARSGADIAADRFKTFVGTRPGLVGYWKFNEGSGQTAVDSSGFGNNGILGTDALPAGDSADPAWVAGSGGSNGPADCNGNGVPDACEIAAASVPDCNSNGVPDTCEPDCNNNGLMDACEIAQMGNDCNGNGVPDACDLAIGTSTDVNANGVPDDCEPDVRLIPVVSIIDPAGTSEIRSTQPTSLSAVSRGSRYFIELWASDVGGTNTGLTGVYADVNFCTQSTATALFNGGIFTAFPSGTISAGKVDEFGGSALPSGGGIAPQWVRVGWIQLTAGNEAAACPITLTAASGGVGAFNRGLINPALIQFGSTSITITPPARPYDLDNSGVINVGDLSLFAASWLMTVPPGQTAHDFDCTGAVGVGDLSWFATGWLKNVTDPTILYPPCGPAPIGAPFGDGALEVPPIDLDFRLAVLATPSSSDTRTSVPTSLASIAEGQDYYVEIWGSDIGDINTGIISAYFDLMLPSSGAFVVNVNHNSIFNVFPAGTSQPDRIDELGGSCLTSGRGVAPLWVRVATVRLFADAQRTVYPFGLMPSATGCSAYGRGSVDWAAIQMTNVAIGTPGPGDLDGDGDVDGADLQLFIPVLLGQDLDAGRRARSDMNADTFVNGLDVRGFTTALLGT